MTGINHYITTANHPKANELVEKQNASTSQSLRACIKYEENWYHLLHSIAFSFRVSQHHLTGKTPFEMMFSHLPLLPIQLKTRPYYMEHTAGDANFINGPKLTHAEILECLTSISDQLDEVHETAAKKISYVQAKQVKTYDACHIGKLLSVGIKVMVKDKTGEARKGNKLKVPFQGPYTICEVLPKCNYVLRDKHGERLVNKFCTSHLKVYMERDHIFKIDNTDMLPVPYCNESFDEEMEAESKGPEEKCCLTYQCQLQFPRKKCCLTYQCQLQFPRKKCCLTYQSQQPLPNH